MGNDTDTAPAVTDFLGDMLAVLEDIRGTLMDAHGELIAIREALETERS